MSSGIPDDPTPKKAVRHRLLHLCQLQQQKKEWTATTEACLFVLSKIDACQHTKPL